MKARYRNFILWYKQLRQQGIEHGWNRRELAWHSRYSKLNCFLWAVQNSGTHNIDGTYFK